MTLESPIESRSIITMVENRNCNKPVNVGAGTTRYIPYNGYSFCAKVILNHRTLKKLMRASLSQRTVTSIERLNHHYCLSQNLPQK